MKSYSVQSMPKKQVSNFHVLDDESAKKRVITCIDTSRSWDVCSDEEPPGIITIVSCHNVIRVSLFPDQISLRYKDIDPLLHLVEY